MKERKPLKLNTELRFTNYAGGDMHFWVVDVLGFGGSCIVYDGYYINNAGARSTVRIKECYPYKLHLTRNDREELIVPDKESENLLRYQMSYMRQQGLQTIQLMYLIFMKQTILFISYHHMLKAKFCQI